MYQGSEEGEGMKDLTGQKFERITVDSFHSKTERGQGMWACTCVCGAKKIIRGAHLTHGKILSCGCLKDEKNSTHRMTKTPTYHVYQNMIARCYNTTHFKYYAYGARGISVCEKWRESFENFYKDMGRKPNGKSIDRIDNNGSYSPGNCRWATLKEQQRNMRTNRLLTYSGRTHCMSEWAEIVGITRKALEGRLYRNWSIEMALTTPMMRTA